MPGVKQEPIVKMQHWRLLEWIYPASINRGSTVIFIYGAEDSGLARKSTPIASIEKYKGSDFEWLAVTESGRKYILNREGQKGMNRDMNQLMCDLDDTAHDNNIQSKELSVKELLKRVQKS